MPLMPSERAAKEAHEKAVRDFVAESIQAHGKAHTVEIKYARGTAPGSQHDVLRVCLLQCVVQKIPYASKRGSKFKQVLHVIDRNLNRPVSLDVSRVRLISQPE